ncbi:hypothetical protein FHL15_001358 [Xylaria flabelliformis]|uniref:RNA helicase n=1 Tax=Xylaria flabelliformis TaxID=2512241 RepID=A0A553IBM2_9PEZI|nr:hypothetical protein FHL15_001358 [Xylaria flabelliformis]
MDDLFELELIGLVSKVASELQNHLGVNDKTLAEFIIAQRLEHVTFASFEQKMANIGGESLSRSVLQSIDNLVRLMHPAMKAKATTHYKPNPPQPAKDKSRSLPGLSLPDAKPVHDTVYDRLATPELPDPPAKEKTVPSRERHHSRSRSRSPQAREKRRRNRSRSPQHRRKRHSNGSGPDPGRGRRGRYGEDENAWHDLHGDHRTNAHQEKNSIVLDGIYDGHVTGIKDFGAFVNLHGTKGKTDGLIHVSQMSNERHHPSQLVELGQAVKAKVISIDGTRVGLSLKLVDQQTGQDLAPKPIFASGANMQALGEGSNEHSDTRLQNPGSATRPMKRMTSPERWEIRQLIASGVMKASDYPDLTEDPDATLKGDRGAELEEDIDIEVREEEPPFLAGQTKLSLELSPIRVVKAPDGSLNRAAMSGTTLAKERAEQRRQEADASADTEKRNVPPANSTQRNDSNEAGSTRAIQTSIPAWKREVQPEGESYGKRTDMFIKQQRESLPVFAFRNELIAAVQQHQILIVVGETGSGKTTQLTQYLFEAGFTNRGIIGCTQPRRVAAMSVAKRVSEEVGCVLGEEVGFSIRFEDCTSQATKIKYMTDGMLQREILLDSDLKRYSVIMLDEAHERTVATDVLFALLKKTLKRRPDLKLIVTSATLDAEKFSTYFHDSPIFTIPGRTFPVEVLYSREPESDYLDAALVTVMQIHLTEPAGDILLFLTGQEEIDTSCEILYERMQALGPNVPQLIILPIYSALPAEMQSRIFEPAPPNSRKIVIATNIAETSITIDNIHYVIDPGFAKQKAYDPKLGMDSLIVTPISQAQANQRAGRAGRTGPGKCFRLYTETAYQSEMLPTTIPDIQRQNLSTTILMLKAMGINDLLHIGFMDPPPINTMLSALEELYALGALDDEGLLTRLGRKIADFPLEPSLAKMLIAASELGCSDEILSIVSMLNSTNVFYRPKEKQAQADQKKAKFHDPHGDHLTLLNVFNSWRQHDYSSPWCFENFIQARSMKQAKNIREQLCKVMERYRQPIIACGSKTEQVRRAICTGFFRNAARRDAGAGSGCYKTVIESTPVQLYPSSALFGKHAEWVVYHELVLTTREYMRWTTSIDPRWLVEAAPTFFKVTGVGGEMSKRRKHDQIQPLYNKYAGENEWRLSAQRRGGRGGGGGGTWG